MKKLKVVILYGGISDARDVSLKSGQAVFDNIDRNKYAPILIDVLSTDKYKDVSSSKIYTLNQLISKFNKSVFFPVLHGEFGEDGVLQYLLQSAKVKFTGSKFLAHSIAINKLATKLIAKDLGIKCARHKFFTSKVTVKEFPVYEKYLVKPNNLGSSVGISIENNQKDVIIKVNELLKTSDLVLVEEYIKGDEVDCAVMSGSVFPLALIKPKSGHLFFDYEAKYIKGECDEIIPAPINKELETMIQDYSLKIHNALGCSGVTRSEYIIKENIPYFLEINTTPGMTETSLVPQQASARGVSFSKLIDRLIDEA